MPPLKGSRLYVNLGASQVRRRLKGFGHGVRKVQAAGRGAACIIHTASGAHLRELISQFTDVGCSTDERELDDAIERLPNLGPKCGEWLRAAGVCTAAELRRLGPVLAYHLVKQVQPRASLNLLWALAGAVQGKHWQEVTAEQKLALQAELAALHS